MECNLGKYSFKLTENDKIEVKDYTGNFVTFIKVSDIKSDKDFQTECMYWLQSWG